MKVKDLKPASYNPRKITDKKLDMLGKSMKEFGDLSGIVFNRQTGNLIGGHQRLKHLQPEWEIVKGKDDDGYIKTPFGNWGYREVDWDEKKEIAANIAANKHGGEFDMVKLKDLLVEIDDGSVDMELTGFDEHELQDIFGFEGKEGLTDDDAVPDVVEPISNTGDLWLLGEHRVLCGDATKREDIERLMDGKKADMVFTDPPYGVSYADKNKFLNAITPAHRIQEPIQKDHELPKDMAEFWLKAFINNYEFMKKDASYYVTGPQGGDLLLLLSLKESGLILKHMLIWAKNNHVLGRCDYNYKHEPILFGWKEKHKFYGSSSETSLWLIDKPLKSDLHPTMKPVVLIEKAINNSSKGEDLILDTFLGSGSTLIACEKTDRICYGMEIDKHYVDVIVKRWEDFTGKKAELERS